MQAVLIGQTFQLQKVWTEQWRSTGTFHALVISGTHVAVLAAVFLAREPAAGLQLPEELVDEAHEGAVAAAREDQRVAPLQHRLHDPARIQLRAREEQILLRDDVRERLHHPLPRR